MRAFTFFALAWLLSVPPAAAQTTLRPGTGPQPAPQAQPTPPVAGASAWRGFDTAVLQTLDKVTGRVRTLEAPIDREVAFGALRIVARTCRKRPPEEPPESAAFIEIVERQQGEQVQSVFRGWMFASAPAVSAMDHAVYDIWVLDCRPAGAAR
jgi:hypothetical protein